MVRCRSGPALLGGAARIALRRRRAPHTLVALLLALPLAGHTTSGTPWNSNYNGGAPFTTPPYDTDGNEASFSPGELNNIIAIWRAVAEDFAMFGNVDVTTLDPGASALNAGKGIRVVIGGSSSQWLKSSAGGIAYLNSWTWQNSQTPCFVFSKDLGGGAAKYVWVSTLVCDETLVGTRVTGRPTQLKPAAADLQEATSHEVGHTLGLQHDSTSASTYYTGQGSGANGWASIM